MGQAATNEVSPRAWRDARSVYDMMSAQLMAGQYLDILEQAEALGTVAGHGMGEDWVPQARTQDGPGRCL